MSWNVTDALNVTNVAAAALNAAIALLILLQLRRIDAKVTRISIVLALFFAFRTFDRLIAADGSIIPYNRYVALTVSICLIVLLILVAIDARRLVGALSRELSRVTTLAHRDPLTGLANRRGWHAELERMLEQASASGTPFVVGLLDLDHFKLFNDTHGHQAGDDLLATAATHWVQGLRSHDVLGRYGGEEFVVLLPNCGIDSGGDVINRLRSHTPMQQTCSAGLALWDGVEDSAELLRRADQALYAAKRAGRDRLMVAGSLD